jgi:hypothetical protein
MTWHFECKIVFHQLGKENKKEEEEEKDFLSKPKDAFLSFHATVLR